MSILPAEFWDNDSSGFNPYPDAASESLVSDALHAGKNSVKFKGGPNEYLVDFKSLFQKQLSSGFERSIRTFFVNLMPPLCSTALTFGLFLLTNTPKAKLFEFTP